MYNEATKEVTCPKCDYRFINEGESERWRFCPVCGYDYLTSELEKEILPDKHDIFTFYEWLNEYRKHGSSQTILNLMNEYLLDYDNYMEWQRKGRKENAISCNR